MIFDARTGFLCVSALNVVIAISLWALLFRRRTAALDWWCGGGLLIAASTLLLALRPALPVVLGYTLGSLLAVAAVLMRIQAIRLELGEAAPVHRVALVLLAYLVLYEWLRTAGGERLRFFVLMSVLVALGACTAWWAWRLGRRKGRRSAYWIAAVQAGLVAVEAVRMVQVARGRFPAELLTQGYDALLFAMTLLVTAILMNIAWLGLALEGLIQEQVEAAAAQARGEEGRRLSERIAHLERSRSLGLLSASLGHELKQPLTAVLTNAQVARRGLAGGRLEPAQALALLDKIVYNTKRAAGIIDRIRGYIRPGESRRETVELAGLVREVAELAVAEARARRVALELCLSAGPLRVTGDPVALSQIALNVLRNAIEAAADGTRPTVAVRLLERDGQAVLQVEDGGAGLTAEAERRAGEPFFTTKPGGLGLGLSISRTIAAQHGGELHLSNSPGGGASAELRLPLLPRLPDRG